MDQSDTLISAPPVPEHRSTRSGHGFVEGQQFVLLVGVAPAAIDAAELEYFREVVAARLGWRAQEVVLRGRTLVPVGRMVIDRVEFGRVTTGERAEVQFDLTPVFPRMQPRRAAAAPATLARVPRSGLHTLQLVLFALAALLGLGVVHLLISF